jgi:hypothetical protein|nr:MAG TPA: hypothetical protein [Caudoviricetes sp.]
MPTRPFRTSAIMLRANKDNAMLIQTYFEKFRIDLLNDQNLLLEYLASTPPQLKELISHHFQLSSNELYNNELMSTLFSIKLWIISALTKTLVRTFNVNKGRWKIEESLAAMRLTRLVLDSHVFQDRLNDLTSIARIILNSIVFKLSHRECYYGIQGEYELRLSTPTIIQLPVIEEYSPKEVSPEEEFIVKAKEVITNVQMHIQLKRSLFLVDLFKLSSPGISIEQHLRSSLREILYRNVIVSQEPTLRELSHLVHTPTLRAQIGIESDTTDTSVLMRYLLILHQNSQSTPAAYQTFRSIASELFKILHTVTISVSLYEQTHVLLEVAQGPYHYSSFYNNQNGRIDTKIKESIRNSK